MQAMTAGRWFLVEDINLAPQDVLAALLPLLETGQLQIPQRAEVIVAEDGFQFISSVTAAPASTGAGAYTASSSIEVRPFKAVRAML